MAEKNRKLKLNGNNYITGWSPTKDEINMTTVFPGSFPGFVLIASSLKDKYGNYQWKNTVVNGNEFQKVLQSPSSQQIAIDNFNVAYPSWINRERAIIAGITNGKNDPDYQDYEEKFLEAFFSMLKK